MEEIKEINISKDTLNVLLNLANSIMELKNKINLIGRVIANENGIVGEYQFSNDFSKIIGK